MVPRLAEIEDLLKIAQRFERGPARSKMRWISSAPLARRVGRDQRPILHA
jgi:hypothetical protein